MPYVVVGQTGPLNCGAACLLCAALELQKTPDHKMVAQLPHGKDIYNRVINNNENLRASAGWLQAIYEVSGNGGGGYSMPSGMVNAALCLGMKSEIVTARTNSVAFLTNQYPDEMQACQRYITIDPRKKLGDLALQDNERAIHCVRLSTMVHWVMQRPDNSYMDPAGGPTDFDIDDGGISLTDRATLKATGQKSGHTRTKYHGTGLVIKVS